MAQDTSQNIHLADIGCGYGAMWEFIEKTPRFQKLVYSGYDINAAMIGHCTRHFSNGEQRFHIGRKPHRKTDYAVFVGTFNLCHTDDYDLWRDYILRQLSYSWKEVRKGLAINITSLANPRIQIRYSILSRKNSKPGWNANLAAPMPVPPDMLIMMPALLFENS